LGRAVPASHYKFGEFKLDSARFELRRAGQVLKLERIPLELLILLAERDGDVVSRQEIVERLWGKDVFLDTEHGINTAIRKIRQALRDDPDNPRFLQTVTGKGYRFVGHQNGNQATPEPLPKSQTVEPAPSAPIPPTPIESQPWRPAVIAVLGLCVVAGGLLAFNAGGIRDHLFPGNHPPQIHSIAVLPLANLSGDSAQDYFAAGMTDELITALAKYRSLRVVSRTSAMQYTGARRPLREIAQELGVDGILEGSVGRSGNRVHMTVQLIYAPSDTHIWAESYDRDLNEIYSLPLELSRTIAQEVNTAVSPAQPPHYINPEAHDAYLRGRYFWFNFNVDKSQEYFEKAVQLQPDYAAAWSGLADAHGLRGLRGEVPPHEDMLKAKAAARKAVELDGSLSEAHNSMAALYLFGDWDLNRANQESKRAIELNPNNAEARHVHAYILAAMNRGEESLEEQKRSSEIDPFARPWALGYLYFLVRQYDAAMNELRSRVEAQPQNVGVRVTLSDVYWCKGMGRESARELEESLRIKDYKKSAAAVREAFESGGSKAVAEWEIADIKFRGGKGYVSPWELAQSYGKLGRKQDTLKYLEDAYREHCPELVMLQNQPFLDFLHSDERYRAMVQKMGLPPAY
jgi:TolB-like protein/DNA-binding winged helix-turn-helix (wHTH) protein